MRRRKNKYLIHICPYCQLSLAATVQTCHQCGTNIPKDCERTVRFKGSDDLETRINDIVKPNDYLNGKASR